MEEKNGKVLWPGWETVRLIGRGSFGAVYEIERDILGEKEKAALKMISIPQSDSDIEELYGEGYDEESITSTFQEHLKGIVAEYSLMRKLNGSANVVNCDDVRYVQHDNGFGWDIFIKMELLTPLTKALEREVSDEQVIRVGKDICRALVLCKKHNIIHRDIKPANIFVSENGDYKLGDFGVAKTVEKTSGGTKIGTYEYMAPEVYHDRPYGSAADIYSLGMVLYWLLNERRTPFLTLPPALPKSSEKEQARKRRFSGEAIPAPAHGSEELKRIVLKACAYEPDDRYHNAEEMLADLNRTGVLDDEPISVGPALQPIREDAADDSTIGAPLGKQAVKKAAAGSFRERQAAGDDGTVGGFGKTVKPEPEETAEDRTVGVFASSKRKVKPDEAEIPPAQKAEEPGTVAAPGKAGAKPAAEKPAQAKRRKSVIIGALAAVAVLAVIALGIFFVFGDRTPKSSEPLLPGTAEDYAIGDIILFGSYEQDGVKSNGYEDLAWIVIDKGNHSLLLLSKKCVLASKYSDSGDADWEGSVVRRQLNHIFLKEAFSAEQQSRILPIHNVFEGTDDQIFCLSVMQYDHYLNTALSEKQMLGEPTPYVESLGAEVFRGYSPWWLSTRNSTGWAEVVWQDKSLSTPALARYHIPMDSYISVRPAMWVSLEP